MRKLFRIALLSSAVAASSLGFIQTAHAVSGETKVSFKFPEIIILHHISSLAITFTGKNQLSVAENDVSTSKPLGDITVDGAIKLSDTKYDDSKLSAKVTINNAWAVRGLTASGSIKVSGSISDDTAIADTSVVKINNLEVSEGASSGKNVTFKAPGLKKSNAVKGGVSFDVDYSGVTAANKVHTGTIYKITAVTGA